MEKAMQKYLDKAEVLIEALPYIQRFNRKVIVVKYGGSAMVDEELKARVIQDVTLLKLVGFKPIIVHGGGKEISKWVAKAGMEPEFINGLRKTDAPTMEIAEMVLNKINKGLVSMMGTVIDTLIICTMTGLSIIITDTWNIGLDGVDVTTRAFQIGLPFPERVSSFLLMLCLVFFAFTTILGWNYYSEKCLEYLVGNRPGVLKCYRLRIFLTD